MVRKKTTLTRPAPTEQAATIIFKLSSGQSHNKTALLGKNTHLLPTDPRYGKQKTLVEESTATEDESVGLLPLEPDSDTSMDVSLQPPKPGTSGRVLRRRQAKKRAAAADNYMMDEDMYDPFAPLPPTGNSRGRNQQQASDIDSASSASSQCVYSCQSCQGRTSAPSSVPINLHHYHDSFYSQYALETSNMASLLPEHKMNNAVNAGVKEMVSMKPTTAAVPLESVILCEVCAGLFRLHRLHCNECYYVPRMDELLMRDCTHCFEGVVCPH